MKNRLKDNFLFIVVLVILIAWGALVVIHQYDLQQISINNNKEYLKTCGNDCYAVPTQPLDVITTFFNNITLTSLYHLGGFAPVFVIAPTVYYFYRKIKKRNLKNVLVRTNYKKEMLKQYLYSMKSTLIFPIFLIILFGFTYLQTGHFDIDYTFSHGGESADPENFIRDWKVFVPVFIFVIWLHSIFWANLGVISVKKNKSIVTAIIYGYILYQLISIGIEIFIGQWIFKDSSFIAILCLGSIWNYYGVTYFGMIIIGLILAIGSTIAVYLTYKNKENLIKECER